MIKNDIEKRKCMYVCFFLFVHWVIIIHIPSFGFAYI